MRKIVLASSSPRRSMLLREVGLMFTVDSPDIDEVFDVSDAPHVIARELSRQKAQAVAVRHPDAIVIAADTIVILDGRLMGKPSDVLDARRMLSALSARTHMVVTGYTVLDTLSGKTHIDSRGSLVTFRELSPDEIDGYVSTGEPLDKAGGYGIQGQGAGFIERIDGDYTNVVGLPVEPVLAAMGVMGGWTARDE